MFEQNADDRVLLQRAATWPTHGDVEDLTQPALERISQQEGIDFATALLYDRLLKRTAVRETLTALRSEAPAPLLPPPNVLVGVVPGAFYKEYAFTGADGQRVLDLARRAGLCAERVPLDSFGSPADNARILADWLRRRSDAEIYLISLSKGGTDVMHALSRPDAEQIFQNVALWLNLSGIIQGTALADWLLARPLRCLFVRLFAWWRGYRFNVLHEIRRGAVGQGSFSWPRHLRVLNVIGFPLRRHLQPGHLAERGHRRLAAWGPNDGGGILLADAVRWPGTVIPLWGVDHYLRQESFDIAALVTRLLTNIGPCGQFVGQASSLPC